ncbi:hypothetical protein ACFOYW_18555 [Gryllotalpicola reticulitermitis]|uniref:Uncharacterized protein n=1 Tax=Gryllotalpicola reticulitermitis TaxID=1184153 RepID=A0ABV8QBP8_9MICO
MNFRFLVSLDLSDLASYHTLISALDYYAEVCAQQATAIEQSRRHNHLTPARSGEAESWTSRAQAVQRLRAEISRQREVTIRAARECCVGDENS